MTETSPRYAEASRTLLRDTVLRATDTLLVDHSWREVTMAQVARAAGVSRQTLYNEFGNRAELAQAYASWAGDQLLDEVERVVAGHESLSEALVAAFTVFLDLGSDHPLIRALGDEGGMDDMAGALRGPENPIVLGASARLVRIISDAWPHLPAPCVEAVAEVLVRLAISHLLLPTVSSESAARTTAEVLGPYIDHVEALTRP
jgi:AcrR family transcriptional regulator